MNYKRYMGAYRQDVFAEKLDYQVEGRQEIVSVDEFSYFVFAREQKELIVPIAVAAVIAVVLIIAVLVTAAACKKALKKTGMFAVAAGTSLLEAFDPAQSYVLIALTVLIAILVVIEIYQLVSSARKKKLVAEEAKRAELRAKRAAADPLRRFIRTDIGRGDVQPVKKDFSALVAASQVGGEENEQSIYTMATLARKMNTAKKTDSVVVVDTDKDTVQTRTVHTSETAQAVAETVQLQQALAEAAAVNVTQEVGRLRAEAAADEDAVVVIDGSQKAPEGGFKQIAASAARTFGEKFAEASAEAKARINGVIAVAHEYGLRSRESRKHLGVFCGRRLIAKVVFRGKTPCVAFALDPSEYAGTKYRGVDMSRYKTYARTPMMIKLTSQRRMGYAEHLARALFSAPDIRRR